VRWLYLWTRRAGAYWPRDNTPPTLEALLADGWEEVGYDIRYPDSVLVRKKDVSLQSNIPRV
jgi:hypothetical protein